MESENSRDQLNAEIIIKDKIIHALRTNDKEADKLAVEELKRLKKRYLLLKN